MKTVQLGNTGIVVPQNGFGALPIQRVEMGTATQILRKAYDGGMRFFDTARAYSDSEEKIGNALADVRDQIYIATKTVARTPEDFWKDLETSLKMLKTDYIDVYQLHWVPQCYKPGDGTGMYEALAEAKAQGKVRHIGATAHKIGVAEEIVESGLYETLQYPFSYLSTEQEINLVKRCKEKEMGFIAMKGLAGGLINQSAPAMAFMLQFDNVVPIWGVQKEEELDEWLAFMAEEPGMSEDVTDFIEKERAELSGNFCRGCGYCMPCPVGITINQCARMSLMLRRAPSDAWLTEHWQDEMKKIEDCLDCGQCASKCPYELQTPDLLKANYADYRSVLAGETLV